VRERGKEREREFSGVRNTLISSNSSRKCDDEEGKKRIPEAIQYKSFKCWNFCVHFLLLQISRFSKRGTQKKRDDVKNNSNRLIMILKKKTFLRFFCSSFDVIKRGENHHHLHSIVIIIMAARKLKLDTWTHHDEISVAKLCILFSIFLSRVSLMKSQIFREEKDEEMK
jgi:hypothetical protein